MQDSSSAPMAILVAAENGSVTVHASHASPNRSAAYLSIALREHGEPTYNYLLPGCSNAGRSFLSIIAIHNNTDVTLIQLNYNYTTNHTQQDRNTLDQRTMQVYMHVR